MPTSAPHRSGPRPTPRARTLTLAMIAGLALGTPSSPAVAQGGNLPAVTTICVVNGGLAQTVRVIYPAAPVRHVHVFKPLAGGPNVVIPAPATPNQVYSLVVPAGRYRMMYGTGLSPQLNSYNPVIVIQPFRVVGRICERAVRAGGTAS